MPLVLLFGAIALLSGAVAVREVADATADTTERVGGGLLAVLLAAALLVYLIRRR